MLNQADSGLEGKDCPAGGMPTKRRPGTKIVCPNCNRTVKVGRAQVVPSHPKPDASKH